MFCIIAIILTPFNSCTTVNMVNRCWELDYLYLVVEVKQQNFMV